MSDGLLSNQGQNSILACEQITVAGVLLSQVMRSWEANISMATQAIIVSRGHDSYVPLELSSRERSRRTSGT